MVPVVKNGIPLMPCSEKRARKLIECGEASPKWRNQIFYIELIKNPSSTNFQEVVVGIDPGSKKEGFTVATKSSVVLNITSEATCLVTKKLKIKTVCRKGRRNRKCPYRKCRLNRSALKKSRIPPSTKARWNCKLRILSILQNILPITHVVVEDIKAISKPGKRRWNKNFSPLETGKLYFYEEIIKRGLNLKTVTGIETSKHRKLRGFAKTKEKLNNCWSAHCVDSHSLVEMRLGNINPFYGMYLFENFNFHRRQLHMQNFKNGIRKEYGTTVSNNIPRGALVKHIKHGIVHIGGSHNGKISLHDKFGKRISQNANKRDITILNLNKFRVYYLSNLSK